MLCRYTGVGRETKSTSRLRISCESISSRGLLRSKGVSVLIFDIEIKIDYDHIIFIGLILLAINISIGLTE